MSNVSGHHSSEPRALPDLVVLHQMGQSFIDSVRGLAEQADAFNNWFGQIPCGRNCRTRLQGRFL